MIDIMLNMIITRYVQCCKLVCSGLQLFLYIDHVTYDLINMSASYLCSVYLGGETMINGVPHKANMIFSSTPTAQTYLVVFHCYFV